MANQPKEERMALWRRIRETYDRVTAGGCRSEVIGCSRLTLQGCEEILEYGCRCIRLAVKDPDMRQVIVCGEELLCLSYHPDAIQVQGKIHCVRFERTGTLFETEEI